MPLLLLLIFIAFSLIITIFSAEKMPLKKPIRIRIATVAMECYENVNENITKMTSIIKTIKTNSKNIDLIIFGEMITSKYAMNEFYIKNSALSLSDKRIVHFQELAANLKIMITFGFIENHELDYYNSQILIDSDGKILGVHRKRNLTKSESLIFAQGDTSLSAFNKNNIKFGLTICYDMFHNEFKKTSIEKMPNIIIHSLADPQNPLFTTGYNGRVTNSVYVSANRFGSEGKTFYNGHIAMVSSAGRILKLKHGSEDYIISDIEVDTQYNGFVDLLKRISNTTLQVIHLIKHYKNVIEYLKWDRKMKKSKQTST